MSFFFVSLFNINLRKLFSYLMPKPSLLYYLIYNWEDKVVNISPIWQVQILP